jgi:PAS domain S-box-containing protein
MTLGSQRVLTRYGAAVLAVGIALGVKLAIAREWAVDTPFLLFLGAVFFAGWFGGVGPGVLATVLAAGAAVHFFVTPAGPRRGAGGPDLRLVQFLFEGGFVSVLSGLRRRSSAEAYRRAEELRVTLASIGDGVVTADPRGRVTFLNPVAEALTGWPAAEAADRPTTAVLRLIDEKTRRAVECPCARVLSAGKSSDGRAAVLVARDGAERAVEGVCNPIHAPDGRLFGVVMVLRDVTERRRAEARLEAEQDRLRTVLEQMPVGILVAAAPGGGPATANPRAVELLAAPPADGHLPLRRPDGRRVPCEGAPTVRALRGEVVGAEDFRYERPDGRPVWLRTRAAPIRGKHAAVTGAVVVFDDVTRERDAEQTLRRSHDVLLSRVATIAEVERRRLSRELHDETSQQLTALILGLRALRDRSAPGPPTDALKSLQGQAEQIGEALHRIACDLRPAALDRLGLEVALRDAVGRWSRRPGLRADFFGTLGPERLPPDVETHVYRMVNEALSNALRHAGAGQVSVVLQRGPRTLEAIVEDDGRGFDAAPDGGAGEHLGLRGMHERAALLGGTVEIESRPGRGTTVFVRVPLPARPEEES